MNRTIRLNKHVVYPAVLVLMAIATRHLYLHDSGTLRGVVIYMKQAIEGLMSFVVDVCCGFNRPPRVPKPYHICPYCIGPTEPFPLDAFCLGTILLYASVLYVGFVWDAWSRKRKAGLSAEVRFLPDQEIES